MVALLAAWVVGLAPARGSVSFASLLTEMTDPAALAQWPVPEYASLEATSYNRESKRRDLPGWFADSDGTGYIRTEGSGDKLRYVLMECNGPGCITKMWTPFFYYDFNERTGPSVQITLDGSDKPVINESLIKLVTGKGSFGAPWAAYSARAGNLYLPIPFAKSCKVTMGQKPFYFSINYRSYGPATEVEAFQPSMLASKANALAQAARRLTVPPAPLARLEPATIAPGKSGEILLLPGPCAVEDLELDLPDARTNPGLLRSTVLSATFDGIETVWCPVGDFFCSADSLHPFTTTTRSVSEDGHLSSRWVMPYRRSGTVRLTNLSTGPLSVRWGVKSHAQKWTDRTMHFFARWRPDDVIPGTPFSDWNYIDIYGKGVYVGDAWTVLNIRRDSWWGEGDEKIYVDDAWDKGFPTHFGTGSEDYYGWAGGVYPVLADQFSAPFLANVKVGGLDGHTLGYNILTRTRGLDAIPFSTRLRFDMESSFGTDMREKWNLLGYSAVTFFYAFPGASHNRPPDPDKASHPILPVGELQRRSDEIRAKG